MHDLAFRSADDKFGLTVPTSHWSQLRDLCLAAGGMETGGILVGYYTPEHDSAILTDVSGPPPDTTAGKAWLHRGIATLQNWLHELWIRKTRYYLGEWHFHPVGEPKPSPTDIREMTRIARSVRFGCPEPVLLLVARNNGRFMVGAFVFPQGGSFVQLLLQRPASMDGAEWRVIQGVLEVVEGE